MFSEKNVIMVYCNANFSCHNWHDRNSPVCQFFASGKCVKIAYRNPATVFMALLRVMYSHLDLLSQLNTIFTCKRKIHVCMLLISGTDRRVFENNLRYFSIKNICCGYSLESPRRGNSNEYPQLMFLWRTIENYPVIIIKYPHLFYCYYCLICNWLIKFSIFRTKLHIFEMFFRYTLLQQQHTHAQKNCVS